MNLNYKGETMKELKGSFESIDNWFALAKPNPTLKDACVQTGCHYEEVAEMASALGDENLASEITHVADIYKRAPSYYLEALEDMSEEDKIEDLDSICDQLVTLVGRARFMGYDLQPALAEVDGSNYSKFENGVPVFNDQGKIAKGKDFFRPDLTKFIYKTKS